MKKKIIIGSVILVVLISAFLILKFVPLGTKQSMMGASIVSLEVPKLSRVKSECCSYEATFSSISSVGVLEKQLEDIMAKYIKVSCNGKTYYYNGFENITITEYGVESGFIFNTFYINYSRGNYCNN